MLRDMGRVLEYSKQAAARGIDREQASIAVTAKRLLSFACQVGWAAVSELLLPIAAAMEATASELVAELEKLADEGLSLLHQAVRSRNVDLVSFWHLPASLAEVVHTGASFLVTARCSCTPHGGRSAQSHAVPSGKLLLACMRSRVRFFLSAVLSCYILITVLQSSALLLLVSLHCGGLAWQLVLAQALPQGACIKLTAACCHHASRCHTSNVNLITFVAWV